IGCHATTSPTSPDASADAGAGATQEIVLMSLAKPELGPQGFELVMMNLDGSSRVQLTDNSVMEFLPHFSPDATKVLYTKFKTGSYGTTSTTVVAEVDITTRVETELTSTGMEAQPVWSPDGSRIAYGGGGQLWVMNADGSDPHAIGMPSGAVDDQV